MHYPKYSATSVSVTGWEEVACLSFNNVQFPSKADVSRTDLSNEEPPIVQPDVPHIIHFQPLRFQLALDDHHVAGGLCGIIILLSV